MTDSSNIRCNWLSKLAKHNTTPNLKDLDALVARPEAEAFKAWLASRAEVLLLPIPVDSPQWADLKRHNDAQLDFIRILFLLFDKK